MQIPARCGVAIPMTTPKRNSHVATAKECLAAQAAALSQLEKRVGMEFDKAVNAILNCKGRIIICGIGKSGAVGQKLAATLASTGTSAFFLHAAEAVHGDLGILRKGDLVILLSYSGETAEVVRLIDSLKSITAPLVCMTGNKSSTLAKASQIVLDISVQREVCPHNLAPTTSTLAMMALGDAIAVALIKAKDFKALEFAFLHPGGHLGARLFTPVAHVMRSNVPTVRPTASLRRCLTTINASGLGLTLVMEKKDSVCGIITDGDIRRLFARGNPPKHVRADSIMTVGPHSIDEHASIASAAFKMSSLKVKALVVTSSFTKRSVGIVDIFALEESAGSPCIR